ncbi:MAG: c-type cytochrome [Mesorhizobium sp.]
MMKWASTITVCILCVCSAASGQEASYGQTEYLNSCAMCHGEAGKGDGPLAHDLYKAPADLTRLSEQNGGEFPTWRVFATVDGRHAANQRDYRDMPIWGERFLEDDARKYGTNAGEAVTTERILELTRYIQLLQRQ